MATSLNPKGKFGTAPVFLTAISTILGAIMFLRFGYSVGTVGVWGTIAIVVIGHLVTIPTALSLAEIATNQKVEGGGEYFIISRSFGLNIGASIGIALFLSQAISVAFYVIAFAEAFDPVIHFIQNEYGFTITKKAIGLISVLLLSWLMLTKGAGSGMTLLYIVVAILGVSLIMFFAGDATYSGEGNFVKEGEIPFFHVFAIIFPAFTGMTAGVGLSGDLKDPKKSIPIGTLAATIIGMVIYVFIAFKLGHAAPPEVLSDIPANQLIMSDVAIWGPIIPIGLAAATISSALGSVMVAPRTLNAIALDKIVPIPRLNYWLSRMKKNNEPMNASLITCGIAFFFVLLGDVDMVAEVISMFFMVTYGSICSISLLENFASNPGYRPAFKSKWYISLIGAVMCVWLMFKINSFYAILAIAIMTIIYFTLSRYHKRSDMEVIFSGVIFQISRNLQVFLQKRKTNTANGAWRPSIVSISKDSFDRFAAYNLVRWISHRIGFATYIHHINGYLSNETRAKAEKAQERLIKMTQISNSSVFVDTLINPQYSQSISQVLQLPGISGQDNNMALFEFNKHDTEPCQEIIDHLGLARAVNFDLCILASSDKDFGYHSEIHIWITSNDYQNANLMIYLAYIILGHPEWKKGGQIKLFAVYPEETLEEQRTKILDMISTGRLPISANNIQLIPLGEDLNMKGIINEKSRDADLTIVGFRYEKVKHDGKEIFMGYDKVGNVLFVNALKEKEIV
ncbi:amino acid permease [bacterium]|nr:amino acid permease [bacterium]